MMTVIDKNFLPIEKVFRNYEKAVKKVGGIPFTFCVEREGGYNYTYSTRIFGDIEHEQEDYTYVERLVKTVLWLVGGYKIYVAGCKKIADKLKESYKTGGVREFDKNLMSKVYENDFEIICCDNDSLPAPNSFSKLIGGHTDGCRIGFDAGGSDMKVSALHDGKVVFSEEIVWYPKLNTDPEYHYTNILSALKKASSKLPRVDALGVSSAGIYVNNRIMTASLFIKVNQTDYENKVKDMYINLAREIGNPPLEVANDGDVTALAGAMELKDNCVLGIAMGTSEAVGYINANGGVNGWLSELAFVPVDLSPSALEDEWSGDIGCGVKYFSQDGVIKLANLAGMSLDETLSPAQKLAYVQKLVQENHPTALQIYADIGVYLGYTLPYYARFYDIKHVLLLGRVMSGKGGEIIIENAKKVLSESFPEYNFALHTPDEKNKRVGQSIAAASLPEIKE